MSKLSIDPIAREVMIAEAQIRFPDECCGFFYGYDNGDTRTIVEAVAASNVKEGDKSRRFEISPIEYLRAETYAEVKDLKLLGIFHSHPQHPAIPSVHDLKQAVPFFSYIIISVYDGTQKDIRSYQLDDSGEFQEEEIENSHSQILI